MFTNTFITSEIQVGTKHASVRKLDNVRQNRFRLGQTINLITKSTDINTTEISSGKNIALWASVRKKRINTSPCLELLSMATLWLMMPISLYVWFLFTRTWGNVAIIVTRTNNRFIVRIPVPYT